MKNTFYNETKTKKKLAEFILSADRLSMGKMCSDFESKFAEVQGRRFCVLYNSGSSANLALISALVASNKLKKGDLVAFSALTWATNVMPILQNGLNPIPVDVSEKSLNVGPNQLRSVLDKFPNIKCLFITNLLGFSDDLDEIRNMCSAKGIILIEDNCESLGSECSGKKLGNFGLASTFSFFVGHHLSTIEGGAVCTDSEELRDYLLMIRAHGWSRNLSDESKVKLKNKHKIDDFYDKYTFYESGYNLRPTEITGVLGLEQLKYLDEIVNIREKNYQIFNKAVHKSSQVVNLDFSFMTRISNFAFPIVCKDKRSFIRLKNKFNANKIEIRPLVAGNITSQPFFKKYAKKYVLSCPIAEKIHETGFYFPNNPDLSERDIERIVKTMEDVE